MKGGEVMERRLSDIFAEDYMGCVFYFCLRRTGNEHEAEDLTADIAYNVIAGLERGTVPHNFRAWVWRIARNRYSVWAERKRVRRERFFDDDVYEYETTDVDSNVESETIHKDEIARLRRELAFISSEYRDIVVDYYINGRKVREIANDLRIPTDTVKSRLFRARKILKEGMDMAKEFGVLSYKPENVSFRKWGWDGKKGEPWCYLDRLFCRNAILAAYRDPMTAKELALEMGVALPYLEDELEKLVSAELIRKNGDKYESNVVVISGDAQKRIAAHIGEISSKLTDAIIKAIEYYVACQRENGCEWNEGYQSDDDMKWALLMYAVDHFYGLAGDEYYKMFPKHTAENAEQTGRTLRPNGGAWDVIGFENEPAYNYTGVGHNTAVSGDKYEWDGFGQYKFFCHGIESRTPEHLTQDEGRALQEIVRTGTTRYEKAASALEGYGYVIKNAEGYCPTFWVTHKDRVKPLTDIQQCEYDRLVHSATSIILAYDVMRREVIVGEIPDFMKNDAHIIDFVCIAASHDIRGAVLDEALARGYIKLSDSRMLGAYMVI